MKSQDLIKMVREDMEYLKEEHEKWERNHNDGCRCFNFDDFLEKKYYRTDAQIVREAMSKGAYIIDAEEFLANEEKKEKAN